MSAVLLDPKPLLPRIRTLVDGRPPSLTWASPAAPVRDQPALTFRTDEGSTIGAPRVPRHIARTVGTLESPGRTASLPEPQAWSASLAQALAETLQGRRPVRQLSRWVDDTVLSTLHLTVRSRRSRAAAGGPGARPASLRSVHLQLLPPSAVEVAATLQLGLRSVAMAFRLEARSDRWICTALDLGSGGFGAQA